MEQPDRPRRVIVVDADNPMVEVNGEFFWREDHEELLKAAERQAYEAGTRAGYQEGFRAGSAHQPAVRRHVVEVRKRRTLLGWLVHAGVNLVVLWAALMFLAFLVQRL